jgi:calcineurin-like phosphoesterase family protein
MNKYLYDDLAARWYRGGRIYFYSDPHFSDPEMVLLRTNYVGDEEQVRRINSKIGKKDTLIVLGDVGNPEWIKKIRGYKVLIKGNHDGGNSNYQRVTKFLPSTCPKCGKKVVFDYETAHNVGPEYAWCPQCGTVRPRDNTQDNRLFDEVYEGMKQIGPNIVLSHEPVPVLSCCINIHGHDHSNWTKDLVIDFNGSEPRITEASGKHHFNMCAEHIDYTPVSLDEIISSINLKDYLDIHRITIDKAIKRKESR